MDRRKFLAGSSAVGLGVGIASYGSIIGRAATFADNGEPANYANFGNSDNVEWRLENAKYKVAQDYAIKHSTCLQCHSECGIRVKVNLQKNEIERIQGNPYHPNTLIDYTNINTPITDTADHVGTVCARGNAGLQTYADKYRLKKPLKRVGARGDNQWKEISWETLIKEAVHGGKIFADTEDKASQGLSVKGFKALYEQRDQLIDSQDPKLGNMTNKFVLQAGRIVKSRKDFQSRFCRSFGTVNNYEHTNICELSHHIATGEVFGGKHMSKMDLLNAKYAVFFGTAPGEANFPMQTMGKYSAQARVNGCEIVVIDPVLPRTVTTDPNMSWLAPKSGCDGAIAAAILQIMIRDQGFNHNYLVRPTLAAAKRHNEISFTNATHLIITDKAHPQFGQFLEQNQHHVVMTVDGKVVQDDQTDEAQLNFSGVVDGVAVSSAFNLLKESVFSETLANYAKEAHVDLAKLEEIAAKLIKHGRQAAVEFYRGIAQHPNGYNTGFLIQQINVLLGNVNWKGGLAFGGGAYDYNSGAYNLTKIPNLVPAATGTHITREQTSYEDSKAYQDRVDAKQNPYPAQRPWFPLGKDIFSEILPSAIAGYPYHADIVLWHMCTPLYSTPSGGRDEIVAKIKDPKVIPLIIASDIVIGDSSQYADYIVPDLTYLEQYVHHPMLEATLVKGTAVRSPVISPITEKTADGFHFSYEQFLIDVAKELNMAGFGEDAIEDAQGKLWPLHTMSDYYLKGIANLAVNFKGIPAITDEEIAITQVSDLYKERPHALAKHQWLDVMAIVSRGGVFDPVESRFNGDQLAHQYTGTVSMYSQKVASHNNSQTGEAFVGYPIWQQATTSSGMPLSKLDTDMQMTILSRKSALQSHSRLSSNTVIREIVPTNYAEINAQTGHKLGLETGDEVWVESHEGKRKATVKLRQGIGEDVVSFIIGYGHTGYGANDVVINGNVVKGDKQRKAGFNLNPIMRTDPDVWSMSLTDLVGGSACFYDTKAKIYKA